jgi:hypothetical protein
MAALPAAGKGYTMAEIDRKTSRGVKARESHEFIKGYFV